MIPLKPWSFRSNFHIQYVLPWTCNHDLFITSLNIFFKLSYVQYIDLNVSKIFCLMRVCVCVYFLEFLPMLLMPTVILSWLLTLLLVFPNCLSLRIESIALPSFATDQLPFWALPHFGALAPSRLLLPSWINLYIIFEFSYNQWKLFREFLKDAHCCPSISKIVVLKRTSKRSCYNVWLIILLKELLTEAQF